MRRRRLIIISFAGCLAATACSGGGGSRGPSLLPTTPSGGSTSANATARLTIVVPRATAARSSARRAPNFVSPSTTQAVIAVNGGTPATYALSPTSAGCVVTGQNFSCTFSIVAPPGNDSLRLTLTDSQNRALSTNVLPVKIVAGQATAVNATLAGVIASAVAVPGAGNTIDGTVAPYHVPGLLPQPIELEALDADGNVIVGPGAPTLAASVDAANGQYAALVSLQEQDPNAYALEALPAGAGGRTITIQVTGQGAALADGTTQAPVTGDTAFLYTPAIVVATGGAFFLEYSVESGKEVGGVATCAGGCATDVASQVAADAKGDLFVQQIVLFGSSTSSSVLEFASGATTVGRTFDDTNGVPFAQGIAVTPAGMLYVANGPHHVGPLGPGGTVTPPSISEYAPGAKQPSFTVSGKNSGIYAPFGLAVDGGGNVYLSNQQGSNGFSNGDVQVYAPGNQTAPLRTISDAQLPAPSSLAVTAAGLLYAGDTTNGYVAYVAPGATSVAGILQTPFTNDPNPNVTFDPAGDLWYSDSSLPAIQEFAASGLPATVTLIDTIDGASGGIAWIP